MSHTSDSSISDYYMYNFIFILQMQQKTYQILNPKILKVSSFNVKIFIDYQLVTQLIMVIIKFSAKLVTTNLVLCSYN